VSHPGDPAVLFSSTFRLRLSPKFNNVELHRPTVRGPAQTNSNVSVSSQQSRTPSTVVYRFHLRLHCLSTMSNSIDQLYVKSSLVELHQHPTEMACPSAMSNSIDRSAMSNSIDSRNPFNNVELRRPVVLSSHSCLRSTMSNSIDRPS